MLGLDVSIEFRVRARVRVTVRATVRDSWGTKRLSTQRLGYEMSGSL